MTTVGMKKSVCFLLGFCLAFFSFACFSCSNTEKKQMEKDLRVRLSAQEIHDWVKSEKSKKEQAVVDFVENLPMEERIAQLFLVNLEGNKKFRPVEFFADGKPMIPGGYLFFSYNVADSADGVKEFTTSINSFCLGNDIVPPLLGIDQEGGLVNRLRNVTSPLPSAKLIAERLPADMAQDFYCAQGAQMQGMGFHLNLAPVAEPVDENNSGFLGTRSYGDAKAVEQFAAAAIAGYKEGGIFCVLKHFPGNTNDDPHTGLPEIQLGARRLEEDYLKPFQKLLCGNPAGVLMSHARTSAFDPEKPACLSEYWVTQKLRNEYGYDGLIFSDDIFMAALEKNGFPPDVAVVMAVEAGVDVIMLSEKRFGSALQALEKKAMEDGTFLEKINKSVRRIVKAKIQAGILSFDSAEGGCSVVLNVHNALEPTLDSEGMLSGSGFSAAYDKGFALYNEYFGASR